MKRKKKLVRTAIAYCVSILLFWIVYYVLYVDNTSNFIINAELNEQTPGPFIGYQDIVSIPTGRDAALSELSTTDQRRVIMPKIDSLRAVDAEEKSLEKIIISKEKISDTLFKAVFKTHDLNIANILEQRTATGHRSIDSLNQLVATATEKQSYYPASSTTYDELMVRISKLNVKKAQKAYEIQVITAKVYDDGFTHMAAFYDMDIYKKFNELTDGITKDRSRKTELLNRIDTLSNRIYWINYQYHSARVSRVSPFDFLYFSIITATTTGYGDILPNNSLIRMLVSAEVLLNLILFGLFFYYLAIPQQP